MNHIEYAYQMDDGSNVLWRHLKSLKIRLCPNKRQARVICDPQQKFLYLKEEKKKKNRNKYKKIKVVEEVVIQ